MRENEGDSQTRTETFPPQPPAEVQAQTAEAMPGGMTRRWNLWNFPPKGKQKGKGKDKNRDGRAGHVAAKGGRMLTSHGGKEICYTFNNTDTCNGSCGRIHVCQNPSCDGAAHPLCKCPNKSKAGKGKK